MRTMEFFSIFCTGCMSYLNHFILVSDISISSIEVEFFLFWAPTHLHREAFTF